MKRPDQIRQVPEHLQGDRTPPGQFLTEKFPILTYGETPKLDLSTWQMKMYGLVENEVVLNWQEFLELQWEKVTADFHCVTQWSHLDNMWEGVLFSTVAALCKPTSNAKFVMAHCYGGYTTNLPLDLCISEGILAHKRDGEPIGEGNGWPLRLVVPSKYAWKSAKWINGIEFMENDELGFWERNGYNNNADPWKEERFWSSLSS